MGNQRFITREQASFTELLEHQESIILDLANLHYYSLNAAATLLWKHLRSASANSIPELSANLALAFNLSREKAELDTRSFIDELLQNQLITPTDEKVTGRSVFTMPAPGDLPEYESPGVKTSNAVMEMNLASGSSAGTTGTTGALG